MDLFTGACAVIATLVVVIPVLWGSQRGVEKRLGKQQAKAEAACRADLDAERKARMEDQKALRALEQDVRSLLSGEVAKSSAAMVFVGSKLAQLAESHDDMREHVGMPPRIKDAERSTTVEIAALTGAPT